MESVLLIHGGAGKWDKAHLKRALIELEKIARNAYSVLVEKNPLNAVLYGLNRLEENPLFNAGRGSSLNLFGEVEVDASIMLGDKRAGAIASVKDVLYASTLAYKVLEETPHILATGYIAKYLAKKHKLLVDQKVLITEARYDSWLTAIKAILISIEGDLEVDFRDSNVIKYIRTKGARILEFVRNNREIIDELRKRFHYGGDTVGVVAYKNGEVAAGTSTGGIFLKLPGRIGDTPLIGAGTYADNELGAVSSTGLGETIILSSLAFNAAIKMIDYDPELALKNVLKESRPKPDAGLIALNKNGEWAIVHSTQNMPAGVVVDGEIEIKGKWKKV